MPQFDLRGIKAALYNNNNGTVSYTGKTKIGDAMNVELQLSFAEGRLYAESTLAEYMKKVTGGSISIGVKYIPDAAQILLFGKRAKERTITVGSASVTASGLQLGKNDTSKNVGVAFYAPDMVDGVEKYTCVFISRAVFGPPAMSFQTAGENIAFSTPTTTGEFMADHTKAGEMVETAVLDSEDAAVSWVDAVLGA